MIRQISVALIAISLTIISGVAYRNAHSDWGVDKLSRAEGLLENLPRQIGSWVRVESTPLAADAAEMLSCRVHANHTYRNTETGGLATVTLMLAPAGPLVQHAPEVCYASSNYQPLAERTRVAIGSPESVELGGAAGTNPSRAAGGNNGEGTEASPATAIDGATGTEQVDRGDIPSEGTPTGAENNHEVEQLVMKKAASGEASASSKFWRVMLNPAGQGRPLAVYYGWHAGGKANHSGSAASAGSSSPSPWIAPDSERFYFAQHGMIYKLQIATFLDKRQSDEGPAFLTQLVPALESCLLQE